MNEADAELLNAALDLVPQPVEPGELPAIGKIEAKFDTDKPSIAIEALYPPDATATDLFVHIEAGAYVPVPTALGPLSDGKQSFALTFASKGEAKESKARP